MKINLLRKALMENKRNNIIKAFVMCLLVVSLSITASASFKEHNLIYDKIGNLNQGFDRYIEYNEFNQVFRVRDGSASGQIIEEYTYDHNGERTKKYEPLLNQTTYYFSDNYIRVRNSTGTYEYVYYHEDDTLIGRKDPGGKKFFYHPDHLGSTDLVTNESGNIIEETTYEPYGEVIEDGDSRFLFTAKELDDTGLYYYGARYYDPLFSHFIQCDQIKPDIYNPQALNCYVYVLNNPYKYVDPNGLWAVQVGLSPKIGLGILGSGQVGLAYVYSPATKKSEFGFYESHGLGFTGAGAGLTADVTYSPYVQSLNQLKGGTITLGASGAIGGLGGEVGLGYEISKETGKPIRDIPSSYSLGYSTGLEATVGTSRLDTNVISSKEVGSFIKDRFTDNKKVFDPKLNNQYSSQRANLNKQQYSGVNNRQNINQNRASQNNRQSTFSRFFSSLRARFRFSRFRGSR